MKRGQISMMIIVVLTLLLLLTIILSSPSSIFTPPPTPQTRQCLEGALRQGVDTAKTQSGFATINQAKGYITWQGTTIPLVYHHNYSSLPPIDEIEESLALFIVQEMKSCVDNPRVSVIIHPESVIATLYTPVVEGKVSTEEVTGVVRTPLGQHIARMELILDSITDNLLDLTSLSSLDSQVTITPVNRNAAIIVFQDESSVFQFGVLLGDDP